LGCIIDINTLSVLTSCPDDSELVLFFNVEGEPTGTALRTWAQVKTCLGNTPPISGVVGTAGLPQAGDNTYTDSRIIGLGATNDGFVSFILAGSTYVNQGSNASFTYNSSIGEIVLLDGVFPAGVDFSISLNQ
jgi:hypothetical protein